MKNDSFISPVKATVLCSLILMCTGCDSSTQRDVNEGTSVSIPSDVTPTEVTIVEAKEKPFEYLINTNGKIEASREAQIIFNIGGTIHNVSKANGRSIAKGEILATIDNRKYKLEMEKAEVQLKERRIAFEDQLLGFKGQDESKLNVIRDNLRYSSGLAASEISFEQAKLDYENTFLKAPINGTISDLTVKEGSVTKIGDVFCTVYDPTSLIISCEILEADAFNIAQGQLASFQPLFDRNISFAAKVLSINPRVNVETGLTKVYLSVQKYDHLLPGMNVNITIRVPGDKKIVVPKSAIVIRSGKSIVFTTENGHAQWNYVSTGRENGKEIEILEGITENQRVIVTNNLQLAHDAPVIIREK